MIPVVMYIYTWGYSWMIYFYTSANKQSQMEAMSFYTIFKCIQTFLIMYTGSIIS